MFQLLVRDPNQIVVTVTVNVFRTKTPPLLCFSGKDQTRYPRGTEREVNVFTEAAGGQFGPIRQPVAVEVRDGLRGQGE